MTKHRGRGLAGEDLVRASPVLRRAMLDAYTAEAERLGISRNELMRSVLEEKLAEWQQATQTQDA